MYKFIFITCIYLTIIGICGCGTSDSSSHQELKWLPGIWKSETKDAVIYEAWQRISKHEMRGVSYTIAGTDTNILEHITIRKENNNWYYIPIVKDQNNNLPIKFECTAISEHAMVFENAQHDFPQIISYQYKVPDSISATIEGTKNGQFQSMTFAMKKVN